MPRTEADFAVLGAGAYGLFAGQLLAERGFSVVVIECDREPFLRASWINQARVHQGYHYPRSMTTALTSARYFRRFSQEFDAAINDRFRKIYAISRRNSLTSAKQFHRFCRAAGIPCDEVRKEDYFIDGTVEAAFETEEYAFCAHRLRDLLLDRLKAHPEAEIRYERRLECAEKMKKGYHLSFQDGSVLDVRGVVSCTYASTNQILHLFDFPLFPAKYEIAEITLVRPNEALAKAGITVMDGPFFSVMPFGLDGMFSLTAVEFTPHTTSYEQLPTFPCQSRNPDCTPIVLQNCNTCPARPNSAYVYMRQLARKYMRPEFDFEYEEALFAIKPILVVSEVDDSRPTAVRVFSTQPHFSAVLSGKINTFYELEGMVQNVRLD